MNSLNGLSTNSIISNLSGLSNGNFDDVNTTTLEANSIYIGGQYFDPYSLSLSSYVTTNYLNNQLSNYVTISGFTNYVGFYYVQQSQINYILSNTLNLNNLLFAGSINGYSQNNFNIGLQNGLNLYNTLSSYVTNTSLNNTLSGYIYNASNSYLLQSTFNNILSNTLNLNNLNFTGNINGYSKANFDNAINYTYSLTSDCQNQLNSIIATLTTTTALGVTTAGYVGVLQGQVTALQVAVAANTSNIAGNTADISALQGKLTTYTYSSGLNKVSIASAFEASSFNSISLGGGLTQTSNVDNTLIGVTNFINWLNLKNGFGITIEGSGGLTCGSGDSSFGGKLRIDGETTINSKTIIKDISTTNSGTLSPYLTIISSSNNSNVRKLEGISIGIEPTLLATQINCNMGYSFTSTSSLNNYGYLGLNSTATPIESFRWFSGGCAVPVGDLTIASGKLQLTSGDIQVNSGAINTNTINNYNSNLVLNSTSTNNIQLNSNNINIGTNQGTLAQNNINIGTVLSASNINLNGATINLNGYVSGINNLSLTGVFAQF